MSESSEFRFENRLKMFKAYFINESKTQIGTFIRHSQKSKHNADLIYLTYAFDRQYNLENCS